MGPLLDAHGVAIVELGDFDEPSLSAQLNNLRAFIGSAMPPAHVFDARRFAANDLWFVSL